jgi:mxaA protein
MHDALNRSAGEVVFEPGLERFVAANPAFSGLRDDLTRFLRLSSREFFGGAVREADDASWLAALCQRCRDAERGLT